MLSFIDRFLKRGNRFLLIPLILYFPFIFLGYGADSDSYETLRTGATFIKNFDYIPSRIPGYFVFEIITLFLYILGGSVATNLAAVIMSLACLYGIFCLCKALSIPHSEYLVLMIAVHPYYWVASTTTMDYIFALGFFFIAVSLLINKKNPVYAGVAFSLAVGSRVTTALLVVLMLVLLSIQLLITLQEALVSLITTLPLAFIFYIPSLDLVGWRWWRIINPVMGENIYWSLFLRAGRFFYKNVAFWSVPALLFFAGALVYILINGTKMEKSGYRTIGACFMILLAFEALFYAVPLDPSYLLPILPFAVIAFGILIQNKHKALLMLLILIFISNFVIINFAKPNVKNFATGAVYGLWLDQGYLVEATNKRMEVISCEDLNCYEGKTQN